MNTIDDEMREDRINTNNENCKKHNRLGEFLTNTTIKSVADAITIENCLLNTNWNSGSLFWNFYRGQQDYDWPLNSNLARSFKSSNIDFYPLQQKVIDSFESRNIKRENIGKNAFSKEWDYLCQAQHAEIKTTLLDITTDIRKALFFATEKSKDPKIENSDAALWCIFMPKAKTKTEEEVYNLNPLDLKENIAVYKPLLIDGIKNSDRILENRMYNQSGGFIAIKPDDIKNNIEDIDEFEGLIHRVLIPKEFKERIRNQLAIECICRKKMYVEETDEIRKIAAEVNQEVYNI